MRHIKSVHLLITGNEFEAILLEAKLIRQLKPHYNSRLKDDKSPLYIVISDETFPRVSLQRKTDLVAARPQMGVYGPFFSSRQATIILKRARHLFPFCMKTSDDGRPCFYTHLGLCPGACSGIVSSRSYRAGIRRLMKLLDGDTDALRRSILIEMKQHVVRREFEFAAQKRDLLAALESLLRRPLGEELIAEGSNPVERVAALSAEIKIHRINLPVGQETRIEGYDISDLRGQHAVASMVVFLGGIPAPDEFRRFRIRERFTPDDPRMLVEALTRRLTHPEWDMPHLVLIDGGEPQLGAIQKAFSVSTHLPHMIPFLGLAKEGEILVIPTGMGEFRHVSLPESNQGLRLLMDIRDHSHRFARRLHHQLREKALLQYNA